MVGVIHTPIDDAQAEMHTWPPDDFCGFGLEHTVPIHPVFEPCPLVIGGDGRNIKIPQGIINSEKEFKLHRYRI